MKFSMDIDDVVFDTTPPLLKTAWRNVIGRGKGKKFQPAADWGFSNWPQAVIDEFIRLTKTGAALNAELCDKRIPYYLNQITAGAQNGFIFATSRPVEIAWLAFSQLWRNHVFLMKEQVRHVGLYGSKIEALLEFGSQLHIDDAAHNVRECLDAGIDAVLISNKATTWNHGQRNDFEHYPSLISALRARKLIRQFNA